MHSVCSVLPFGSLNRKALQVQRYRRMAAAAVAAIVFSLTALAAPMAVADAPTGAACEAGKGVTVVVDYSVDGSKIDARCAAVASGTVAEAFTAAGFQFDDPSFVTVVDGVAAADFGAEGWWQLLAATTDGSAAGAPGTEWVASPNGLSDAPVSTGQHYLLRGSPSFDCWDLTAVSDKCPAPTPLATITALNTTDGTAAPGAATAGGMSWPLVVGIVAAVVLIGVAVGIVLWRRRGASA